MKKSVFLTSVALLALASCSEDEMKQANRGRAIDFRAVTASRATETTMTNLKSFYVTAFDGTTVYDGIQDAMFANTGGFFLSETLHYWPEDESKTLSFAAYSPAVTAKGGFLNGDLTLTGTTLKLAGFAPRYDLAKQVDFIHAFGTGSKKHDEKTGVALNFNHALSQIEIKAMNGGTNKFTIAGFKIVGVTNTADYDNTYGWSTAGKNKGTYKVDLSNPIVLKQQPTPQSLMAETGTAMLIPQRLTAWKPETDPTNTTGGAYLAVKVNIKDNDGKLLFPRDNDEDAFGWVAVPISTNWEAGKKYVYTLDFATGAGVVAPPTGGDNKVDPGLPGDEADKDHPKNDNDPSNDNGDPEEQKPGGGGQGENPDTDPEIPQPGETILDTPIMFKVTVTEWTEITENPSINL
ncbi:MAG: fimbrillin family protein [Muribaculaceae bacterium]|nr:fimbrillin family protein [Muribaculaceae bacterium]